MSEFTDAPHACIRALAGRQGGFVTRRQLYERGVGRGMVASWARGGRLIRVWPQVYAVGHVPTEERARAHGAQLAAGHRSALAGWSAAALYGAATHVEPVELISPEQRRIRGLKVRRCSTLRRRDVTDVDGLAVTSPARTALDLAARVGDARLHGIVDQLRLRHGLTVSDLSDIIVRNPRHPGAARLRRVSGQLTRRPTRSALERRWPALAARFALTPYEQNEMVAGHEVDVLIDGLVVVELDTVATHRLNFASDRHRDAEILARTGIPVIRLLDTDLDADVARHAGRIQATLARRRAERAAAQEAAVTGAAG